MGTAWALAVHWETPPGQRDGYLLSVLEKGSSSPARNLELGKDSTNVTLTQLTPGVCYLVGIWAVAGAFRSLPRNTTGCTGELHSTLRWLRAARSSLWDGDLRLPHRPEGARLFF